MEIRILLIETIISMDGRLEQKNRSIETMGGKRTT